MKWTKDILFALLLMPSFGRVLHCYLNQISVHEEKKCGDFSIKKKYRRSGWSLDEGHVCTEQRAFHLG